MHGMSEMSGMQWTGTWIANVNRSVDYGTTDGGTMNLSPWGWLVFWTLIGALVWIVALWAALAWWI